MASVNRLFRITISLRISWALLQTLGAAAAAPPLPGMAAPHGTFHRRKIKHEATVSCPPW